MSKNKAATQFKRGTSSILSLYNKYCIGACILTSIVLLYIGVKL